MTKEAGGSGQNHGEYQRLNEVGVEEHRDVLWKVGEGSGQEKKGGANKNSIKEVRKNNFKGNS